MKIRIYLASPYTHEDELVMRNRFNMVCQKAAELMARGYIVFSPIVHSHPIAQHLPVEYMTDFDHWMEQDLDYIRYWADVVWVFCIDGWSESKGVIKEMNLAFDLDKPVRLVEKINYHYLRRYTGPKGCSCQSLSN